jgi:hypothetical protein
MSRGRILLLAAASLLATTLTASAASTASDNAADPAYSAGWTTGTNGGIGFEPWTVGLDTGTGAVVASSSINGASPPSGNIDVGGVSWGLYSTAASGNFITATRPLTGNLAVGQQILCDLDTGTLGSSGYVNLALLSGNVLDTRFSWFADATEGSDYRLEELQGNINVGVDSGIAYTSNGLHLDFTLTGTDTFTLAVTPIGGTTRNYSGTLDGHTGAGINQIQFLVDSAGSPPNADSFINNFAVVPEPTGIAIAGCAGLILARRRGRSAIRPTASLRS